MRPSTSAIALLTSCFALINAFPTEFTGCDVFTEDMRLPAGQTTLKVPADAKPIYVTAGAGTQNYTCSDAGQYTWVQISDLKVTSIGVVAELFDVSCLYKAVNTGRHYFVENPTINGTGVFPKFDFTGDSHKGDQDAFVVTAKKGGIPAPSDPDKNVDWLELSAISGQGDLAKYVFRIDTTGGQPPTSCKPESPPITVPYFAHYWFFK